MQRLLGITRIGVIWLLIILLVLELSLRLMGFSFYWAFSRYPDLHRGYAPLPGADARQDLEGHARIRINRFGFRDRDWADKPPGVYRIAVLGDSFTAAVQVPLEVAWWRQVEGRLQACDYRDQALEVMNFAVSGYGMAQQLETLRHHVAIHQPDEVWLTFFPGNDVTDNHPSLSTDPQRPYLQRVNDTWQMDYSFRELPAYRRKLSMWGQFYYHYLLRLRVTQAITLVYDYLQMQRMLEEMDHSWYWEPGIDARVYAPPQDPVWHDAWETTRTLVAMIRDEAEALGATLRVLGLSTGAQVHPEDARMAVMRDRLGMPDLLFPNWLMGQFAAEDGFDYIDLAAPMARRAQENGVFFHGLGENKGNGHWNTSGHTAMAELLAARLCKR